MGVANWNRALRAFARQKGQLVHGNRRLLLAAFLSYKSAEFRRTARGSDPARENAAARRLARQHRVKYLKRTLPFHAQKRVIIKNPSALLFRPSPHYLRDTFCPEFLDRFVPMRARLKTRERTELVLTDFSFAKSPRETMRKIALLVHACEDKADVRIAFLDQDCDDVTPYVVLSKLRSSLPPVISGGRISPAVREVVDAVGMREALKIGTIHRKRRGNDIVSAFRMHNRTPPGLFGDENHLLRPQVKEAVADRFVDTLNGWIEKYDLQLTPAVQGSLTSAIGEALDNAERHGDAIMKTEGEWSIAAFSKLIFDDDGRPLLHCSIGIVSIGATISQSLESAGDLVRNEIDTYVSYHMRESDSPESKERLRMVMALQDGITRDARAERGRRGGVGLMELAQVVAELGDNDRPDMQSVLTIISGKTCLRITGPFRQGRTSESQWRRELWFNSDNHPSKPPSQEHVVTLDHSFPGVIVSACFTIDPENILAKLDDNASHG